MNKRVKKMLVAFLAIGLLMAVNSWAGIPVGNAGFDDHPISGNWTADITPWVTPNDAGGWAAWVSENYYNGEPPTVPAIYTTTDNIYQELAANFQAGVPYVFSIDVGTRSGHAPVNWTIYIFDATAGDYTQPLAVVSSTDPGQEPVPESGKWYRKSVTYVADASVAGHKIGIGFTGSYYALFDNAAVDYSEQAYGPDPENEAKDVMTDQVLSWHTGVTQNDPTKPNPAIIGHMLYMNSGSPTDPNLVYVATIPAGDPVNAIAQYTPPAGLRRDGVYLWRVDEQLAGDANVITGNVWQFKTVPSVPVLNKDMPVDLLVDAGQDVSFSVSAVNPFTGDSSGMTYQWYKYVDGTNDTALADGSDYTGAQSATLTVNAVQVADEGAYYCRVTISSNGASTDSRQANLVVKRLVGHWPLNGNLDDIAGTYDGTMMDPNFVAGGIMGGQALDLKGDGRVVVIPDDEAFNFYPTGYTVSAWVKTIQPGWGAFVSKQATDPTRGFILTHNYGRAVNTLRQSFGDLYSVSNTLNNSTWHLVTGTYDAATGTGSIYVDGKLENTAISTATVDTSDAPVIFGAELSDGSVPYVGLLNDVRIYNYPISAFDVAKLYTDVQGGEICAQPIAADLNGDCRVDMEDFAILAAQWLECNMVPTCWNGLN